MNKICLVGNVTREVELSYLPGNGTAIAKFGLAVRRDKDNTDFINCVAFGKLAETISTYVNKGNKFGLTGRLQIGSYEKDGIKRYTADVIVQDIDFIEKSNAAEKPPVDEEIGEEIKDDTIPF